MLAFVYEGLSIPLVGDIFTLLADWGSCWGRRRFRLIVLGQSQIFVDKVCNVLKMFAQRWFYSIFVIASLA